MKMPYTCLAFLLLLTGSVYAADEAVKNHRAEKRQDNSFVFFGGWRPVKTGSDFYHGSASGRYHDLISALPGSLDSHAALYTHSFPSSYPKDIYSYYPRPAIKATPKKNTPVYVEKFKPRRQQPKQGGRNTVSAGSPQFIDIQKLELKHLQGLQDVLLQAKEVPLTQINLPKSVGKPYEILELAVQPLQQNNHGSRSPSRYNRNRGAQGNNKGSYGRIPQNRTPAQLPLQFQYITVPKLKSLIPQGLPKQLSITPVKIPHPVPSVDDILGLKNIQVVEVPVPANLPISISASTLGGGSQYGKRNNGYSQAQYRMPSPKSQQKSSFPGNTYYANQAEQPRKHYPAPSPAKSSYGQQQQHQPQIEAELIKLSEDQVQNLLKNLQVVKDNTQDFLKILPVAEAAHKSKPEHLHLFFALPQGHQGKNTETSAYESQSHGSRDTGYGNKEQYITVPQQAGYGTHDSASISQNSGGYQISSQNQGIEHNAAGYQIDAGNLYEQPPYEAVDGQSDYGKQSYDASKSDYSTAEGHAYAQAGYSAPASGGVQSHREQYIEVISPQADETGYRREPVLAVEIQKGQTIEDAIKAIDPETLQRLGAHGKDGLEIEVVEVPIDEYSAESKKTETYVSSSNTTTTKSPAKRATSTTTVSKEKSTATEKKS